MAQTSLSHIKMHFFMPFISSILLVGLPKAKQFREEVESLLPSARASFSPAGLREKAGVHAARAFRVVYSWNKT